MTHCSCCLFNADDLYQFSFDECSLRYREALTMRILITRNEWPSLSRKYGLHAIAAVVL